MSSDENKPSDQKKIRARNQSLESKSEDPNYDLVRKNTELNSKPSIIDHQPQRRSKSTKKVTFDGIQSENPQETAKEPLSFTPLTIDTGSELSFADFMPDLSLDSIKDEQASPVLTTLPIVENNTIIKKKKLKENYVKDVEYYQGYSSDSGSEGCIDEEIDTASPRLCPEISDPKSTECQRENTLELETNSNEPQSPAKETEVRMDGFQKDYQELQAKYSQLESSLALLQEENIQNTSKYDDLQSRFSQLEKMYFQTLEDKKMLQTNLSSVMAENQKLKKKEIALLESQKQIRGLSMEVKVLQTHCNTFKKQIDVYDREIF